MINSQIRAGGVRDKRVLEAMERVPRHLFVHGVLRASFVLPDLKKAAALAVILLFSIPTGPADAKEPITPSGRSQRVEKAGRGRSSLKQLSDRQLVEFMSLGSSDLEEYLEAPKDHRVVPERFWDLPAGDAARLFLEVNQIPEDRKAYRLFLDAGADQPPGRGTLVFCDFSDKSYTDLRSHHFLRFDPLRSYYVYAGTRQPGLVGYDYIWARTTYSFLFHEMNYRDAAHFAQFIWWLTKAGTKRSPGRSVSDDLLISNSSSDGQGRLVLTSEDGGRPVAYSGWLTGLSPAFLWAGAFGRRARLDSVGYAFDRILPKLLPAGAWLNSDGPPDKRARLIDLAGSILSLWSPEEAKISSWHAAVAAQAAGDLALSQYLQVLEAIRMSTPLVPAAAKSPPARFELDAEFEKLKALTDPDESREKYSDLMQEISRGDEPRPDSGRAAVEELGLAVDLALRKIACANDVPALTDWAKTRDKASTWARVRLLEKSPRDLARILEDWMSRADTLEQTHVLDAIFRTAPDRAAAIAARVFLEKKGLLRAAAADILSRAELSAGGGRRPDALIEIVRDPKAWPNELEASIRALVPADDPSRFPGGDVDVALMAALQRRDGAPAHAAQALAWRERTDQMEPMWSLLESMVYVNGKDDYERALSAVTYLARRSGPAEKERLARLLLRNFARTDIWPTEFLLSAWSADLRDLAPKLARMATASPSDYEKFGGGRYHLARKIVALWREEDLLTRGKLLIAFGLKEPSIVDLEHPERGNQMREELSKLAGAASAVQKTELSSFLAWCESAVVGKDPGGDREAEEAFVRLVRQALGLTSRFGAMDNNSREGLPVRLTKD